MNKEEAIKYLQQLYPNGSHCWLDEQRIEAISMAVKALQEEPVPKVFEDMLNAKTAAESLGISPEKHDKIVDECLYGKETELVDEDDLPVSEDLDVIAREYAGIPCDAPKDLTYCVHDKKAKYDAVLFGANWKEQQFEKNRLKHCDSITKEQAQIESDFVAKHLKENNRTPTFLDAIEYGMRLQKSSLKKIAPTCVMALQLPKVLL